MRQFSRRLLICRGTPDLGIEACPASRTELLRLPGEVTQVFTTDKFISRGTLNRSVHGTVLLAAWCFEAYASAATGPEPGRAPLCCCTFGFERSISRHTPPTENLIVEGTNIVRLKAISVKAESRSLGEQFATELVSITSRSNRSFRHPAKNGSSHQPRAKLARVG